MSMIYLPLSGLFIFYLFKWLFVRSSSGTFSRKSPPSPPRLPVIGNLHQLGLHPHRSLQSLSKQHGPLMLLHLGSVPVVVASSANAAREIMKDHDLVFSNRPKSSIADGLFYGSKDIAFAPYGEYWRQVRSICVLHMLSNKRVQSFRAVREEETSLMIERIRQTSSSSTSSSLINLRDVLMSLTNNIVCRVALGRKYCEGEKDQSKYFKYLMAEAVELMGTFDVGDYVPWLKFVNKFNGLGARVAKVAKEFDEFLEGVLEEHRERNRRDSEGESRTSSGDPDLVDILLQVQNGSVTGFPLSDDSVKALILDMFAAGTDTTQTLMEWAMTELLRHPKTMKKLQEEVRKVAREKSSGTITEDDLEKLNYLKAVIKESLRLHAPVPLLVPREATQDVKVMGYEISAGTKVMINAWAIGRDPLLWDHPEEFRPERFLINNDDSTAAAAAIDFKGFNFELIPFGAGRRGCPGITFGTVVNELALAKLVNHFDFELANDNNGEELDMSESSGITIRRKLPLLAMATPAPPSASSSI